MSTVAPVAMVDQEKPFKTVEVVDSRTAQVCKIACMSCIRGHRTTSCGIPVCRNKVFWTVKRPGRPSASCTCRYGATGGCKCVVAKSACPHKAKKGEKRSGECRCDEQGRYCCVLEPEHWAALFALQKPHLNFFATREALEESQLTSIHPSLPSTPAFSNIFSPPQYNSVPNTPGGPIDGIHHMKPDPRALNGMHSPQSTALTPRFGMMGIGAPQGNDGIVTPNLLSWQGQAPQAPEQYHTPSSYQPLPQQQEESSCCQSSAPVPQQSEFMSPTAGSYSRLANYTLPPEPSPLAATIAYNKMTSDYFSYQLPNAICQNCGLSGCTCRNCPPVMQSFVTGSWAQCCGRKHARTEEPPQLQHQQQPALKKIPAESDFAHPDLQQAPLFDEAHQFDAQALGMHDPAGMPDFNAFDLDPDFGLPDVANAVDISDMLIADLDEPPSRGGCCCDDP